MAETASLSLYSRADRFHGAGQQQMHELRLRGSSAMKTSRSDEDEEEMPESDDDEVEDDDDDFDEVLRGGGGGDNGGGSAPGGGKGRKQRDGPARIATRGVKRGRKSKKPRQPGELRDDHQQHQEHQHQEHQHQEHSPMPMTAIMMSSVLSSTAAKLPVSCARCKEMHKACSMERPCLRCARLGYLDCKDAAPVSKSDHERGAPHRAKQQAKRQHVVNSCLRCRDTHKACSLERPCTRCVRLGHGDTCTDVEVAPLQDTAQASAKPQTLGGTAAAVAATASSSRPPRRAARASSGAGDVADMQRDGQYDAYSLLAVSNGATPLSSAAALSLPGSLPFAPMLFLEQVDPLVSQPAPPQQHDSSEEEHSQQQRHQQQHPSLEPSAAACLPHQPQATLFSYLKNLPAEFSGSEVNFDASSAGQGAGSPPSLDQGLTLESINEFTALQGATLATSMLLMSDAILALSPHQLALENPASTHSSLSPEEPDSPRPFYQDHHRHGSAGKHSEGTTLHASPDPDRDEKYVPSAAEVEGMTASAVDSLAGLLLNSGGGGGGGSGSGSDSSRASLDLARIFRPHSEASSMNVANVASGGYQYIALLNEDEARLLHSSMVSDFPSMLPYSSFSLTSPGNSSVSGLLTDSFTLHPPFAFSGEPTHALPAFASAAPGEATETPAPSLLSEAQSQPPPQHVMRISRPMPIISESEIRQKNVFVFMPGFEGDPLVDFFKDSSFKRKPALSAAVLSSEGGGSSSLVQSRPSSPTFQPPVPASSSGNSRVVKVLCADQNWFKANDVSVQKLLSNLAEMRKTVLLYRDNKRNPDFRRSLFAGVRDSLKLWERVRPNFFSSAAVPRYVPGGGLDADGMPLPSVTWDLNAQVIDVNESFCRFSGYTTVQILKEIKMLCALLGTQDAAFAALCHLVAAHSRVAYYECSFSVYDSSQTRRHVRLKVNIVRSEPDGDYLRSVAFFQEER